MLVHEKVFYERVVNDVKIMVTDRYIKVGDMTYDLRHVQAVKRVQGTPNDTACLRWFIDYCVDNWYLLLAAGFVLFWMMMEMAWLFKIDIDTALNDAQDFWLWFSVIFYLIGTRLLMWSIYKKRKPYRIELVFAGKKQRLHADYLFEVDDDSALWPTLDTAILKALDFEPSLDLAPPVREVLDQIELNMVAVEGGEFLMGAGADDAEAWPDERPQHQVKLDGFKISRYPVTQAQWQAVMGSNPSHFEGCDDCPVESVSWDDTQEFIRKLNLQTGKSYRLPTEAEWEYAARGGNKSRGYRYAGGNDIDRVAWYDGNSDNQIHPVGQKQANELGLYDMSGNVWEWCGDWYGEYSNSAQTNSNGPLSGSDRVRRGGSWHGNAGNCRVSNRYDYDPDDRYDGGVGFRLVLP